MSKRASFGSQFERLRSMGVGRPADEQKQPSEANRSVNAPEPQSTPTSSIVEETLSGNDTVTSGLCEKRTVSTVDTVAEGFTKVPHSLLRGEKRFGEPLDFVVYMHLFTYSHGFGRKDAHMSQAQLERFTGAAKNTIKRCLERLSEQGWIKCIEEYECARMSRKWRVFTPEEKPGPKGKRTVATADSVKNEQSPTQTGSLSAMNTPTVSKIDPFLERIPKEKTKNSLSPQTTVLREYLNGVTPFRKRESEWAAYQGLRHDFSEEQIASCIEYLKSKGVPGNGEPCHSPLGFLSKAMGQVLGLANTEREKRERAEVRLRAETEALLKKADEELAVEREAQEREAAFVREFPDAAEQAEVVAKYAERYPMLARNGPVVRSLAISSWWSELNVAAS